MYLLSKDGRKHYLEFLRNVTPQALLVFIGTVFMHGGLHGQPTAGKIAVGCALWLMAALAAWCNASLFLEPLKESHVKPGKERALAAYPNIDGGYAIRLKQSVKRWWHQKRVVAEVFAVMMIIEATCVVAAASGGFNAVNALHLG